MKEEISQRDWLAGQALANPNLCSGEAMEYELRNWFGDRTGITKQQIAKAQAYAFADEMLRGQPK